MNQNKSKNNKKRKEKKKSSNSIEKEESEEVTSLSTSTSASLSEQVNGQQNGTINRGVGRRIILKNTDKKSNEYSVEGWSRNLPQNSPLKKLEIVAPKRGEAEKLSSKKAEAVRKQRTEYYFSTNAGSAPSSEHFQKNIQHPVHRYPIEKNEQILIENKYDLMIKATLQKCDAWWIRVKSQDCDEKFSVSGLIANNSTDEEIRKACDECLISFDKEFANRKYEKNEHSVCSKTYLESKYITEIHEKSETFPEAIYYCNLCDYHMNNVCHAKTHLETSNHFDDVERWTQRTNLLNKIPSICENQSAALKKVLDEEFEKSKKARKIDSDKIKKVIDFLKLSIFENLGYSDVIIQQLGSTVYDVDLMDSDLNLTFSIPSIDTLFLFNLLNKIMKEMNEKYSILVDYANDGANMSTILFNYEDIPVRLCWFSASVVKPQHCFVELMKTYVMLRPEVAKFLRLVRVWATKANLDSKNKQKVGLPRYGFDIMAIHFLQQKEMIPILHQLNENDKNGDEIDNNDQSTSSELVEEIREKRIRVMSQYMKDIEKIKKKFDLEKEWNISELWVNFFKYYLEKHRDSVIQITQKEAMSKDVTKWNRKSIHVVDPFRGDNVLAIPKVSTWMPYFFNCILSTYLLFSIPRTRDGCVVSINLYQTNKTGCLKKKPRFGQETRQKEMRSSPRKNVQLNENKEEEEEADAAYNKAADEVAEEYDLNFYTEELMKTLFFDNIPLIKLKENDVEIDDHLNGIFSRRTFMRVRRKFKNSEHRFLIDSIKEKELIVRKKAKNTLVNEEEEEEDLIKNVVTSTHQEEKKEESLNTKLSKLSLKDEKTTKQVHEFGEFPSSKFGRSSEVVHIHENQICFEEFFINANFKQKDIEEYCSKLKIEDYFYEFDGKMFSGGCEQETKCIYCEGNHRVDQCSSMNTPPIEMLAKRTKDDIEDLDKVIDAYYTSNIISQHRLEILESAVKKLETYLKLKHDQNIILTIFGSVMTGIGQYKSDIDICLRFEGIDEPMKNINPIDVINEVSELLRRYQKAKRVQAITTAKVPIVKFQLILSDGTLVDADISYYNILAIYNTRLLQHYTLWTEDNRFAKLGLFIKYWAKQCDIGDASKGSISSYAYILLLISYLQQCDPPVLPILQEMCREKKRFVENWDTYFYEFESIDVVRRWQKNRQTCAELLMGFFDYYANYRFKHFVIQCRREAMLSKLEKDWNKPLCIEDPFDLSHNLGSGVTKKMFIFIHRNFICSRKVFMTSTPTKEMKTLKNFCDFYRLKLIKDCWQGKAPIDRLCHFCGRVGHFVENCPRKLAKSEARKVRTSSLYSNASIRQKSQAKNANEKQKSSSSSTPNCLTSTHHHHHHHHQQQQQNEATTKSGKVLTAKNEMRTSPTKMSQNGSSGYFEGDTTYEEMLVSMPEHALVECFGNLALSRRPAHLRPPAAFCLPFVSMKNDVESGHALKHLTLTSVFDALHPYVGMPALNRRDVSSSMQVYWLKNSLGPDQLDLVHRFALELQVHLSACFGCPVVLDIYGSTRNGFGTRMCDVDMSLSFYPSPPVWATNSDRVMRAVAKALVDFPKAVDERYVNAKVPIVRFRSSDMDMEADISYKNDLALHNTQLLQQYCRWDPDRLPTLGVWIKAWAKRCGIGEASKGSLSSYAWIVMLIHYLQQVEPSPVMPCLQEVSHGKSENVYVQGYNLYYWKFVDAKKGQNCRATVLDLFVGFLEYYSSYFDYSQHVVQMSSKRIQPKPDRWIKFPMCIADPFETDHNLAQGVDMQMFQYIRSCMEHSRSVFTNRHLRAEFLSGYGSDVDEYEMMCRNEMDYEMAASYGEFLLHKCIMLKQAPHRQFRDRSMSQSTSTSNTSISS